MKEARCCGNCQYLTYEYIDSEPTPLTICNVDIEYEGELVKETDVCDSFTKRKSEE